MHLTRDDASTQKYRAATFPSTNTNTTSESKEKHAFLSRKSICTETGGERDRKKEKKD